MNIELNSGKILISVNLVFLDNSKGHTKIRPKNHYSTLEDNTDQELAEAYKKVKMV